MNAIRRAAPALAAATTLLALAVGPGTARAESRTEGLIPYVLVGPKVTTTLFFPPSLMVGAEVKVLGWFGASFEYGLWPRDTTVDVYSMRVDSWSLGLRAYPFRGTFFVGAVLGNYGLHFKQPTAVAGLSSTLDVTSLYLGPQIGWKWDFDFGLFLGLNLGYGFSLNYQSNMSVPALATSDLGTVQENLDKYIKVGVPVLTLLEIGWFF